MRAVILAGGRGSRLAPFTSVIPKPLLPVGETPILEIIIRQLVHAGFDHITLTLGYLSVYFHSFIAQHRSLSRLAKIDFVEEETPTGTAGSLASIPDLGGTFLVMNGDILSNIDYRELLACHRSQRNALTIALHQKDVRIDLGVIKTDGSGCVTEYIEKPTLSYGVSMGIYVYDGRVLDHIEHGKYLDFPNLVHKMLAADKRVGTYANDATWLDLGRLEDLQRAAEIFERRKSEFLPEMPTLPYRAAS